MTDKPEDRDQDDGGNPTSTSNAELTLGGNSIDVPITTNDERK